MINLKDVVAHWEAVVRGSRRKRKKERKNLLQQRIKEREKNCENNNP